MVNEIRTVSESTALMPSSRYCGLNAICICSPSKLASIASLACASSPVPASSRTSPGGEGQPDRGVPLGDQGDALDRVGERRAGSSATAENSLGSSVW